ncbi:MAG: beta-glucuronidase [Eubacterium sp.]|nr:beta-glucuronidase [Eubacterium sp.]
MLYPVMTQSRGLMDLSGIWSFKLDNGNGFEEKWYEAPLADAMTMAVPSSYNDLKEGEDFREHYGWVFYQRTVSIPSYMKNERIMLRLAAVTHSAKVYLNGSLICEHKGGFLPFEVQLNEYLKDGENLLTIAVDNRIDHSTLPVGNENGGGLLGGGILPSKASKKRNNPNFDFFNYCGITRPVKIYTTPQSYIADVSLSSDVDGTTAHVSYEIETIGDGEPEIEIRTREGMAVAKGTGAKGSLTIEHATLWQPLKAYLYEVEVKFGEDTYVMSYGIRTVKVEGGKFLINGQPFYFKGYGKHEDTFPAGRGLNLPMNIKDISLMKWQGANSFRTSHYPYSEEMMQLCDEEGIVVIDEVPAVGVHLNFGGGANFKDGKKVETFDPVEKGGIRTFEHHKEVVRDVISRDKNRACVVMWSIANESDSGSKGAYEYFKPLYDLARELDPQKRPCTIVSVQMANYKEDCTLRLSDVYCLNRYYGWYMCGGDLAAAEQMCREELEFWNAQGKPFLFTEYGADTVSGLHDTTPVMWTEEYQVAYYQANHRVTDTMENFVGEQVWNFADFATSQGLMRVQGNKKGLFTRDRRPKLAAHYFRERWTKIPDFGYKK